MKSFIRLTLLLISTSALLSACSSEKQVSFNSGGMTHTFASGNDATKKGFLLPVYPGAKPTGGVSTNDNQESNSFLMLTSNDPVTKIGEFYREQLKKEGWTTSENQFHPSLINLAAQKEKLEANVLISAESDKTSITLSVGREPEGKPEVSTGVFTPDKLNPPTD